MDRNTPLTPELTPEEAAIRDHARRHVQTLAGLIGPRHEGRPSSIDAASAYIERTWREMGYSVGRQAFPSIHGEAANLIAEVPGRSKPDEIVILGAHYDTVPETPGADDNASAVAGLLEVSRLLAGGIRGRSFNRTLRLIAFANEEPPHFYTDTMGSQHHARACRRSGQKITAMVCLEMIGYFDTSPGSQRYPAMIPRAFQKLLRPAGDFIAVVANPRSTKPLFVFRRGFRKAARFPLIAVPVPEAVPEIRLSDHGPFWDEGFRAMMVTDMSFFRNPHYHLPSDTPDTLDYERLARVILGVAGGVAALAGGAGCEVR